MKRNFIRRGCLDVSVPIVKQRACFAGRGGLQCLHHARGIEEGTRIDRALQRRTGRPTREGTSGPQSTRLPSAEADLVLKVGPDCYPVVGQGRPVTQAAIDKLLTTSSEQGPLSRANCRAPQADS